MVFRFDRRYYLFIIVLGFIFGLGPTIILVANWNIMEVWPSRVPTACVIAFAALIVRQGLVYYRRNPPIIEVRDDGVILHADCNGRTFMNISGAFLPWRIVSDMDLTQTLVDGFASNARQLLWVAQVRLSESVHGTHLDTLLGGAAGTGVLEAFTHAEPDTRLISLQGMDAPYGEVFLALESSWGDWRYRNGQTPIPQPAVEAGS